MFVPFKTILDDTLDRHATFRAVTPKAAVHRLLTQAGQLDMTVRRYAIELEDLRERVALVADRAAEGDFSPDAHSTWVDWISDLQMWQVRLREKLAEFKAALAVHGLTTDFEAAHKRLKKAAKKKVFDVQPYLG